MGSGKTIVFLVCQKFPSHPSHFSLIFHNLVQVPVLVGLLAFPSPANTGSCWKLYSQSSPGVVFALTPLGPRGTHILEKAFSGSPGASAQGTRRSVFSFGILLGELVVLRGSLQVPSYLLCRLTPRMVFHGPVQETSARVLSIT
ncbi:unnamed protein product [Rangifer tarandus platyrhynchus]|uniref:Uncharacterized protein n=2 Tax=Rangifer tarandus platyrhynchus TaxID=3082113 RepID=A0AC59Z485_RANTA|nr:unnamed protein product [Rangifer tarandus platyrhynchus]